MSEGIVLVIGIIIGLMIMLIIVAIFYSTRIYVFEYCPTGQKYCMDEDYYNDPSEALARGHQASDILFIDNDKLYYNRVQKNKQCTPDKDRTMRIRFPRHCSFTNKEGEVFDATNVSSTKEGNKAIYFTKDGKRIIATDNCQSVDQNYSGMVMDNWD